MGGLTCRATQVLGATRKNLSGFSSTAILQHTGYIFYCGVFYRPCHRCRGFRSLTFLFVFIRVSTVSTC